MPTLTLTNVEDQVFTTVRRGQDAIVDGVQALADRLAPYAARLPEAPWAERVPTATELAERAFAFAEKLISEQKDFAERLLDAAAPLFADTKVTSTSKAKSPAKPKTAQAA
ncbi:MAG: hypothetical protein QOG03_1748 [Actinomycetota bacterium]|nr:hypothetical protein [Actinomycetota bacterium]